MHTTCSTLSQTPSCKVVALITVEVHARDVMEHLHHVSAHGVGAFEWTRQLRLYWSREVNECMVEQACGVQLGSSSSSSRHCSLPVAAP